jgi:hypothetical protein
MESRTFFYTKRKSFQNGRVLFMFTEVATWDICAVPLTSLPDGRGFLQITTAEAVQPHNIEKLL